MKTRRSIFSLDIIHDSQACGMPAAQQAEQMIAGSSQGFLIAREAGHV
jgi:hypothetical protein